MALRLLLFSSDSDIALVLGNLLAESDMQVESCSEMLISLEKLTRGNFDLIVVDWDDGAEANFLLKTARELKSTRECLAMALVSDPASAASAVQAGAHGILNKPIVPEQVQETLATIRELIASRQNGGVGAASIAKPEASARAQRNDPVEPMSQEPPPPTQPTGEAKQRFLSRKPRELPSLAPLSETPKQVEGGKGTLFSSFPDSPEPRARKVPAKPYRQSGKRIAATLVLLFAAALAYIWAPGSSYLDRLGSLARRVFINKEAPQQPVQSAEDNGTVADSGNSSASGAYKIPSQTPAAPAIEDSSDDSSSDIQVIPVMNSSDSSGSTTTVVQPASSEAQAQPDGAQGEAAPAAPAVSNSAPPSLPSAHAAAHRPRPSTTAGESGAQLPSSLNLSNPINPMQTAAAPVFSGALTPVVVPEETAKQLLVNEVPPSYPGQALRAGLQGAVVLQALIARDGSVRDVTLVRGSFVFARAAVEAVKQWQYKPYLFNGQAVEVQTLVTVNFRLPASSSIPGKSSAGSAPTQGPSRP
jgi:TonB family protein